MKKIITFFVLSLITSSVFAKKVPEWINNAYQGYDESKYICAVGSGLKTEDADKKALADVASVLIQDINSVEVVQQTASSDGKDLSSYLANITTNSDVKNISGLSIKDRYKDKKTGFYSRAILDKNAASKNYSLLLNKNIFEIETLIEEAAKRKGSFDECKNLVKAYRIAKENDYYNSLLTVLKPSAHHVFSYGSSGEVAAKIQNAFGNIVIAINVAGDIDDRVASAAASTMSNFGFSTKFAVSISEDVPYVFMVNVSFEDIDNSNDLNIYFTRCVISCILTEKSTGKDILTYSSNSRQGKLSRKEAQQSALRAAEKLIAEDFSVKFQSLFSE